jgi:hypothetical protein
MICFKDMTFCSAYPTRCKNITCARAFTELDREAARQWWGKEGAPVAYSDFSEGCKDMLVPI